MSSYLGYDPALLANLATAMGLAGDGLRRVRSSDQAAAEAVRTCQQLADELDASWTPIVRALASCGVLEGYRPVDASGAGLADIALVWTIGQRGLRLASDPLAWTAPPMSSDGAAALASWLNQHAAGIAPADYPRLTALLTTVAASSALSAAFHAGLDDDTLPTLIAALGRTWVDGWVAETYATHPRVATAEVDALLAALGSTWGSGAAATVAARIAAADDVTPAAAARFVAALHLSADELASITATLLRRENGDPHYYDAFYDPSYSPPHVGDVLFPLVIATPGAPSALLVEIQDRPELAFAALDPALTRELLRVGVAPDALDAEHQEAVVRGLLALPFLDEKGLNQARYLVWTDDEFASTIADVFGSYALSFVLGAGPVPMSAGIEERNRLLDWLTASTAATQTLAERRSELLDAVGWSGRVRTEADQLALDEMAMLGQLLDNVAGKAAEVAAQDAVDKWEFEWKVIEVIVNQGGQRLLPVSPLRRFVGQAGVAGARGLLESMGYGPEDVATVVLDTQLDQFGEQRLATATAVALMVSIYVADGSLPASTPLPPLPRDDADGGASFHRDVTTWAYDHLDADQRAEVLTIVDALSPAQDDAEAGFLSVDGTD